MVGINSFSNNWSVASAYLNSLINNMPAFPNIYPTSMTQPTFNTQMGMGMNPGMNFNGMMFPSFPPYEYFYGDEYTSSKKNDDDDKISKSEIRKETNEILKRVNNYLKEEKIEKAMLLLAESKLKFEKMDLPTKRFDDMLTGNLSAYMDGLTTDLTDEQVAILKVCASINDESLNKVKDEYGYLDEFKDLVNAGHSKEIKENLKKASKNIHEKKYEDALDTLFDLEKEMAKEDLSNDQVESLIKKALKEFIKVKEEEEEEGKNKFKNIKDETIIQKAIKSPIGKDVLIEIFPEEEKAINKASKTDNNDENEKEIEIASNIYKNEPHVNINKKNIKITSDNILEIIDCFNLIATENDDQKDFFKFMKKEYEKADYKYILELLEKRAEDEGIMDTALRIKFKAIDDNDKKKEITKKLREIVASMKAKLDN